jgi:hypothetical protein
MPFGLVNGRSTFIAFIHNMNRTWQDLACSLNLIIDDNLNTTIIVDNIMSWAKNLIMALVYMECQLRICHSQNPSLSLMKLHIFVKRFEFIGVDVCINGNQPAQSKHQLIKTWPAPELVRDVAKFARFIQFYAWFIPHFEVRIAPLRVILQNEYSDQLEPYWSITAKAAFDKMRQAILSDPCLRHFDHCKLLVLCTDFYINGFGYVACQPANNELSLSTMTMRMKGGHFDFMTKNPKQRSALLPLAVVTPAEMRLTYIHTWAKASWAIGQSKNAATCALGNVLLGLQTATQSNSSYHTIVAIPLSFGCKCASCAGI